MINYDRSKEILNNWTPETASLIATLKRHGFEIVKGHNGEEGFKFTGDMKKFIANLIACDEAHLYVKCPKTGRTRWIYLVFGNSPGELASDYSIPVELTESTEDPMDKATSEHYNRWEGRKQPKHTAAQAYPNIYGPAAIAEREAAIEKLAPTPKVGAKLTDLEKFAYDNRSRDLTVLATETNRTVNEIYAAYQRACKKLEGGVK